MAILPPGVPPLLQPFNTAFAAVTLLTSDSPSLFNVLGTLIGQSQWGIFDSGGNQVVQPDNISVFGYRKEYVLSDYPVEQGGFETYDKVETPYEVKVSMTKGGTLSDRQEFLTTLQSLVGDTNLYSFTTPEVTLVNGNITSMDYSRRADRGMGLITVELTVIEVMQDVSQTFANVASAFSNANNVQSPPSAATVSGGTVQGQTPTATQQSSILSGFFQ